MLDRKILLTTVLAVCMAVSMSAQENKKNSGSDATKEGEAAKPSGPPAGLQWANRDMTYHGQGYDIMDSTYYPKFRQKQLKKYLDHQEAFPPKPQNMWEVGIGGGTFNVLGDIPTLMLWQKGGGGINLNVRKSIGYMFSMRLQYIYGVGKNLDQIATTTYAAPYTSFQYVPLQYATTTRQPDAIYRSTRTEASVFNMDFILNAGNISFHRARNKMSVFGYVGLGMLGYKTRVNALDKNYNNYQFTSISGGPGSTAKEVRKALQKGMDKSWETEAESSNGSRMMDNKSQTFAPSVGAGIQYKINKQYNIQVENRVMFTTDPYLDGTRFGPILGGGASSGKNGDAINYFSFSVNYNVKYKKSVEPLYWMNPLDHGYNELSYPRHMILPNPVLPDKDEDGITDQFDKCPKTPAGVKTDSRGCPLDSDNDGVPDYLDKQIITPTECWPVDADGVGHCPCPDGCKDIVSNDKDKDKKNPCGNIGACTLMFPENSKKINKGIELQLSTLAAQMQAYPRCKVVITGGGSGSKIKEQRSWEHVNAIIEHMGDKFSIPRERFIFKYGDAENENIVQCRPAAVDEDGDANVPPPHPDIK